MYLYILLVALLFCGLIYSMIEKRAKIKAGESLVEAREDKLWMKRYEYLFVIYIFVILWWLTAFRAPQIGNDTKNYIDLFNSIREDGVGGNRYEYGYQIYCYFLGLFTSNAQILLIVTATLCWGGLGVYIFLYSKDPVFSVCLAFCFCFSIFTNVLRQSIAMIILLYAYELLKNKKKFWSLLLFVLAVMFHATAIIFFVVYLYKSFPKSLRSAVIICGTIVLMSITGILERVAIKVLPEYYASYFESAWSRTGWLAISVGVVRNFVICYFVCVRNRGLEGEKREISCVNYFLLCSTMCFGYALNLFDRISMYFLLPMIVDLPNSLKQEKAASGNFFKISIASALLFWFLLTLFLRPEWTCLYPYEFWN